MKFNEYHEYKQDRVHITYNKHDLQYAYIYIYIY